ncbi:aminotransferase class I/II-fold pyridoxal phosphate-dependent enzyme [Mesobaculum littorinae]|uniref:Aminotransferase n=1 Tax=Mesobaculum littorinae TaxID=2486419 RepID=A0A438AKR0_9RHOB|nr:aminotransferase class I/II-fold pyridoxal phosphate-dependent enzyme [Mesobaculum littorinae]RVV99272.1 aminotransferase class I/II-fold pyridoxal phosphate-dependent enzyme [Mesobaculum littorinae]
MRLSSRIEGILGGGSDAWGLFIRARQLKDAGQPVVELTIGEPDSRTAPAILQEMHRAAMAGHTGYAAIPGIAPLRDAIAARVEARTGVPTTRDNVLVTPGGQAALFAAHQAVTDPGDTALICDPYYATYPTTIRASAAHPRAVATRPEHGFQPQAADLAAVAQGARSLLINTPNNPTGAVYSRDTLDGIAQVARDHDLWVISDEVYDTQVWTGDHLSPRALPGMAERTMVIGSLSKSHAMTGSRLGWLIAPPEAIARMADLAVTTTYGVPGYIQEAGLFALLQGPDAEERNAAPYRRRRDLALSLIAGQKVVRAVPAQGAMYLMLDIRDTGLGGTGFAEALLDRHLIAVMPGEGFGDAAAGHVRIALTLEDAALRDALATLLDFAAELSRAR